jgi:hypothetical protein
MKTGNQTGYLILADISGYTSYIARSEIENAQILLAELLKRIVEQFKPILSLSRLEGDAVFAYTTETLNGETLLELIDATYIAFREGQELFRGNLCDCEACQSLPTLDLKFVIHHGEFAYQRVSDFEELVGTDVNIAHRLLKNHVANVAGWRAYALFSEAALEKMSVQLKNLFVHTETYDHLGEIKTFTINLAPRHQKFLEAKRFLVTEQDADLTMGQETRLPPHEVWEWLTDPSRRIMWENINEVQASDEERGIGRENRCLGEKRAFIETVLDWKPFDYYSIAKTPQMRGGKRLPFGTIHTFKLNRTENGGTQLNIYCKVKAPLPQWITQRIAKHLLWFFKTDKIYGRLRKTLQAHESQTRR